MHRVLFPSNPLHYSGEHFVRLITLLLLSVVVIRSLIHLFIPETAAELIAGLDIQNEGGDNVVAMFSQWGAVQLILVALLCLLFFAYPGFTPLVLLVLVLDAPLRYIAGQIAPLDTVREPPGQVLNWPYFIVVFVLFLISLREKKRG